MLASPCDAIVGACGRVDAGRLYQVKGFPYALGDLLGTGAGDGEFDAAGAFRDGWFVTLRLTAGMYHRFHAPHDLVVDRVTHVPGDAWNVNPVALRRVDQLYCKNERAAVYCRLAATGHPLLLVPVAAILVAGIRFHFCDLPGHLRSCEGHAGNGRHRPSRRDGAADPCVAREVPCPAAALAKGEEMGWFEHGSTIVVFAPAGFALADGVHEGTRIKAGQPLMRLPPGAAVDGPQPGV